MIVATAAHVGALKWGAFAFGSVIGWNLYFVNRYRKLESIGLSDVTTLIGALGGTAILALFPAKTQNFAFYGFGLAAGFFAYFLILVAFVVASKDVKLSWFLTGAKGQQPMLAPGDGLPPPFDE